MSGIITIRPLTPVGIDFDRLREESQALGFNMLDRLAVHWMDGSNAFSAPGERLLGAFLGDALVGVGGLNRCPFDNHPRAVACAIFMSAMRYAALASAINCWRRLPGTPMTRLITSISARRNPPSAFIYRQAFCRWIIRTSLTG